MHMRHKEKIKRYSIVLLLVFISVITVSLISGRINTEPIVVVEKDGVDITRTLGEQTEFFGTREILKSEIGFFQGSVVRSLTELEGKKLLYPLSVGSPIPLSALTEQKGAGEFASSMPRGKTIHKLTDAVNALPPVQVGDVINIALTINTTGEGGAEGGLSTGLLLESLKIHTIAETNIYVEVTLEQDLLLSTAAQVGSFIYQLPGQKTPFDCSNNENSDETNSYNCLDTEREHTVISKGQIIDMVLSGDLLNNHLEEENEKSTTDKVKEGLSEIIDDVVGTIDEENTDEGGEE